MTLPVSGSISLSQINTEFGLGQSLSSYVSKKWVKGNGTTSGTFASPISLSHFLGTAGVFEFTINSDVTNGNLRTLAINAGWDQKAHVIATLASGKWISSSSTGTPALLIDGSFPSGVRFINNGIIHGMGGTGGSCRVDVKSSWGSPEYNRGPAQYDKTVSTAGGTGGTGVKATVACMIDNKGTIAGGGGGGGGSGAVRQGGTYNKTPHPGMPIGGGGGASGKINAAGGRGYYRVFEEDAYGSGNWIEHGVSNGNPGTAGVPGAKKANVVVNMTASRWEGTAVPAGGGTSGSVGGDGDGYIAIPDDPYAPDPVYTYDRTLGEPGNMNGALVDIGKGGGAAGKAIEGNTNITWIAAGTRKGSVT